jgi:class 3 adenylate cyclase
LIKPRPPSAVLTFLFTDIEGSTRRWEADADAMRVAIETHNKVLRGAVEANDGTVFNYTGDGMCAVFSSPRWAVDAAVTAQGVLELPVRRVLPLARPNCATATTSAPS